jgi:hypothetical protein
MNGWAIISLEPPPAGSEHGLSLRGSRKSGTKRNEKGGGSKLRSLSINNLQQLKWNGRSVFDDRLCSS